MRILITGASGFVGGHLARHYSLQGHQVLATGRSVRPPDLPTGCRYISADLSHSSLKWPPIDVCIHVAGLASDSASWPALYAANVMGTKRLLASLTDDVKLIFISSSSVYLPSLKLLNESDIGPVAELSPYGRSKLLAEKEIEQAASRFSSTVILRPRAIYGVGDRVLLPRLLRLAYGKWLIVPGDLRVQLSMTHIDNLRHAVECAMCLTPARTPQTFNIADITPYELREIVLALVSGVYNRTLRIVEIPVKPLRWIANHRISQLLTPFALDAMTKHHTLNLDHAKFVLGYQPERAFSEAVPEIIQWGRSIQKHPASKESASATPSL
jgi:2-alkyl-3-oxoalkanoate reductase